MMSLRDLLRRPRRMTLPVENEIRSIADALLVNVRAYVDGKIDHETFTATAAELWKKIPRHLMGAVGELVLQGNEPPS